jgi:hypothetical protein
MAKPFLMVAKLAEASAIALAGSISTPSDLASLYQGGSRL